MNNLLYCASCSKQFKRKTCFEKHVSVCLLVNSTDREFVPNQRDVFNLVKELHKKYESLDKRFNLLQNKYNQLVLKEKISNLEFLKKNIDCSLSFQEFVSDIVIDEKYILYLIENNLTDTILFIFNRLICEGGVDCIQMFENKKNTIYIFNTEWSILDINYFHDVINIVKKKILDSFKIYVDQNKEKLYEDYFSNNYLNTIKKLTCENKKELNKLKAKIYEDYLKKIQET